jgi:hypothetical protein
MLFLLPGYESIGTRYLPEREFRTVDFSRRYEFCKGLTLKVGMPRRKVTTYLNNL